MFLSGVKVLSLTHFLQGPSAVQFLADLGADVVKVEPPGRGAWERVWSGANAFLNGESVFYLLAHRNQRDLALDWKTPPGKEVLTRLVRWADVLVENFRPGVLDRAGFSYQACAAMNPRLIYCAGSGYGPDGPYRDLPGQDLLVQAVSGLVAMTGQGTGAPTPVGVAAVDQHAAALLAMGAMAGLLGRERTGRGTRIDVSLLAAALDLQVESLGYYLNGGQFQPRSPNGIASTFHEAPYGVYATRDDWIVLSLTPITKLAKAMANEELSRFRDDDAYARREEIAEVLTGAMHSRTTAEWLAILRAAGVWCAPVNNYDDIAKDPQVLWAKPFVEFDHPRAGRVRVLGHPIVYDGKRPEVSRRPPQLGEHGREILGELGYSRAQIEDLRKQEIVSWS